MLTQGKVVKIIGLLHFEKALLAAVAKLIVPFFGASTLSDIGIQTAAQLKSFLKAAIIRKNRDVFVRTMVPAAMAELFDRLLICNDSFHASRCQSCRTALDEFRRLRAEGTSQLLALVELFLAKVKHQQVPPTVGTISNIYSCN